MTLLDTQTKIKISLTKKSVNIYLCGPTVYDDAHLGHARSSICFDLLRRVLIALNFDVKFARNYTDIDDKILKKMQEKKMSLEELSEIYIKSYERDMKNLRVLEPDFKPRATNFLQEMISLIQNLDKKGFCYILDDGVYFDTSKDKDYFSLSHKDLNETQSRLQTKVQKRNESDFVLWKFDENFYEAPFGKGRPGWHSECVAMIQALFKDGLDIHCGGIDLLFPHHENEATQHRCEKNKNLAQIWLHNGFIKINDEKMSKSLNNSFFVKDALKEFQGEVLRLYLLSVHYRAHFNYALEDLETAKKRLDKFYRLKKRLFVGDFKDFLEEENLSFNAKFTKEILANLQDDLNISKALAVFDEFITWANLSLDKDKNLQKQLKEEFKEISRIFGLGFLDEITYFQSGISVEFKMEITNLIAQRQEAKKAKQYQKADEIRENLLKKGIVLMDTPNGTIWEKI